MPSPARPGTWPPATNPAQSSTFTFGYRAGSDQMIALFGSIQPRGAATVRKITCSTSSGGRKLMILS
ncbi:unannotated protein [freshwater metagenome]|uniref:Unannotated protein n=1 Tax=freshwater metagenome TaxID=449393 RepID=A0A6J6G1U8_9ZZZZ